MGAIWAFVIVELDPLCDLGARFRAGFPSVQVNAFVIQ